MPRRKNHSNKTTENGNSGTKRKTISPVETAIAREFSRSSFCEVSDQQNTNVDIENSELVNKTKRFHCSSPEYSGVPSEYNLAAVISGMAFQQTPFTPQAYYGTQQTPYNPQFTQSPPSFMSQILGTPVGTPIPQWASALMEDVKSIKQSVSKLEAVEKTVNLINQKFVDLEVKVSDIDKRVTEVERSCSFVGAQFETNSSEIGRAREEIFIIEKSCKDFEKQFKKIDSEMQSLNNRMTDSESRSMRNNLIFYGITEKASEDCEKLVKDFINEKLEIDANAITFDRVHRMGNTTAKKPRPIVARFHYYTERESVRTKTYDRNEILKEQDCGVSIQRPKNVRDARKSLYSVMKREKEKGNEVKFVGDKLYINGQPYIPTK